MDYHFIQNKIIRASFQIKNTRKQININFVMLDKPAFQQWLAEPIEDRLMLQTTALEINRKADRLEVITNNGTLQAKLVILANGTNYKFQKKFGLVKENIELIPCIGGFFRTKTLSQDTAHFYYDEALRIALWAFPKGGHIFNAGAGAFFENARKRLNLSHAFERSMNQFGVTFEGEHSFGGSYVTSGPIYQTYSDHLIVCGDSAGQTFAGIGEGIYFSLSAGRLAGNMAAKAIRDNCFHSQYLKKYEVDWRKSLGPQLDAGVIFATCLFFLMRHHLTHTMLKIIKPQEIHDIWISGRIPFRIKLFYSCLKRFGCSPQR
jgi:flavin-dependent dehydrogenase